MPEVSKASASLRRFVRSQQCIRTWGINPYPAWQFWRLCKPSAHRLILRTAVMNVEHLFQTLGYSHTLPSRKCVLDWLVHEQYGGKLCGCGDSKTPKHKEVTQTLRQRSPPLHVSNTRYHSGQRNDSLNEREREGHGVWTPSVSLIPVCNLGKGQGGGLCH